jgi:hypothetical protein
VSTANVTITVPQETFEQMKETPTDAERWTIMLDLMTQRGVLASSYDPELNKFVYWQE